MCLLWKSYSWLQTLSSVPCPCFLIHWLGAYPTLILNLGAIGSQEVSSSKFFSLLSLPSSPEGLEGWCKLGREAYIQVKLVWLGTASWVNVACLRDPGKIGRGLRLLWLAQCGPDCVGAFRVKPYLRAGFFLELCPKELIEAGDSWLLRMTRISRPWIIYFN